MSSSFTTYMILVYIQYCFSTLNYCATAKTMANRLALPPNVSICQSHQEEVQIDQINESLFWTAAVVSSLVVIFGVIANILVIYFANQEPPSGTLHHLNKVVKHLAASDVLYGVLGIPLSLAYWRMGKTKPLSE